MMYDLVFTNVQESADLENPAKTGRKGSLTKKQKRDLVRKKTGDLIDGLAGAVHSGNILSNLKPVSHMRH